jgi:hypothetical protein
VFDGKRTRHVKYHSTFIPWLFELDPIDVQHVNTERNVILLFLHFHVVSKKRTFDFQTVNNIASLHCICKLEVLSHKCNGNITRSKNMLMTRI